MTERLEGADRSTLPSTDVVLTELKTLRQREGVSHERVRRYATAIQTLPCVIDERVRRRFSEGDEHVAAYNVIGCTIENVVRDPRKRVILRHTLNYEGNRFDLDSRRQAAADELAMSTSACEPIEARAYIDLAALLVDATSTPCHSRQRIVTDQEVFEAFQNFRNLRDLQLALSVFARESETAQREASARVAMDRLPRGRVYLLKQPDSANLRSARQLEILVNEALDVHYSRQWRDHNGRWRNKWFLNPVHLKAMFDRRYMQRVSNRRTSRYEDLAMMADRLFHGSLHGDDAPYLWDDRRKSVTPEFYAVRRESIRWLASVMRNAERHNLWGSAHTDERSSSVDD